MEKQELAVAMDGMAKRIFAQAIAEDRCGELFVALADDGTATVDNVTGLLVIITAEQMGIR